VIVPEFSSAPLSIRTPVELPRIRPLLTTVAPETTTP
jgi:hypothetical protein